MADAKITELTAETAPINTDLLVMVDDPSGTPATKKVTIGDLIKAALVRKQASGTSTSGSAGTSVASLAATAGNKFIGWSVVASQTATASSGLTVTITYTDDSTITTTTSNNTAAQVFGNAGGLQRMAAGAHTATVAGSAKEVKTIAVVTAGSGSGTRAAIISAIEVKA
jgi:hypothetical protein